MLATTPPWGRVAALELPAGHSPDHIAATNDRSYGAPAGLLSGAMARLLQATFHLRNGVRRQPVPPDVSDLPIREAMEGVLLERRVVPGEPILRSKNLTTGDPVAENPY